MNIGDKHYSQEKPSRVDRDNKVITEKRGILSSPPKKGVLKDAVFSDMNIMDRGTLERINELNEIEKLEFKKKIEVRKNPNKSPNERPLFRPPSPNGFKD